MLNPTTNEYQKINAFLAYSTDHLYFWIQDNVPYEYSELQQICETFENQIYPLNRELFGKENTPGIDSDEHLYILYTSEMGAALGYFSSADTNPQEIDPYSNEAEMFMVSATYCRLDDYDTYGVLAHEFQHMIHHNLDRNETSWINEGFSELATLLNGYDVGGTDILYALNTDIQLNTWPRDEVESTLPHYGASYLFMTYLYDRFGEEFSRALVANPLDGLKSIDAVLDEFFENGKEMITAEDVFQDWTIANLLQDSSVEEGFYGYESLLDLLPFQTTETINLQEEAEYSYAVHQYGIDYFQLDSEQPIRLEFQGQQSVQIVPADPHSGDFYYWSNKGDQSAVSLSQTFDFREVQAPIALTYYTWFDIEQDWDFVYLLVSEDGENWQLLEPSLCTKDNLTGSNQGCGYTGSSNGWQYQEVDLSQFAGKEVTIRFEYLTDTSLNGEGLLLDDIRIDAIEYNADLEESNEGWVAKGFVRISNTLPQTYRVSIVQQSTQKTQVTKYSVFGDEILELSISPTTDAIFYLVVSGTTRYTEMPAVYSLSVSRMQ